MEMGRLTALLSEFRTKRLLVLGDVMLDRYIWGKTNRLSPEAPVPIVHVQAEAGWPGGAANVARNLKGFAQGVTTLGIIGTDVAGDQLLKSFSEQGLSSEHLIRDPDWSTPEKTRVISRNQQIVRIDREFVRPMSSSVATELELQLETLLPEADAVIVADYGKGLISQSLANKLAHLTRKHGACSCVDPHPKSRVRWTGITAIKPNLTETFRILNLHEDDLPDASEIPIQVKDLGQALHRVWDCDFVLITLGNQGMALISREGDFHHQQVRAREIFDVSGAGDTAIALFALGLCSGATAREATEISSLASSLVVGKVGTSAVSAQELLQAVAAA